MTLGPHVSFDLNLSHFPEGVYLGWGEWRAVYGGGVGSFFRWVFAVGHVPDAIWLGHLHVLAVAGKRCHRYLSVDYCYCDEAS